MEQFRKELEKVNTNDISHLKGKFEQIIQQPTTRKVKLKYSSCCGCGCTVYLLEREVPFDSDLKDYDKVRTLEDTDIIIEDDY